MSQNITKKELVDVLVNIQKELTEVTRILDMDFEEYSEYAKVDLNTQTFWAYRTGEVEHIIKSLIDKIPNITIKPEEEKVIRQWYSGMKNCVLCSRYTNNRKLYIVPYKSGDKEGAICDYCKKHERIQLNNCIPKPKDK